MLQLRPEDDTSDNEFHAILKYSGLAEQNVCRMRIEKTGIPDLNLDDYSAVIVGGSPFDISTPKHKKPATQIKIEHDFNTLLGEIVTRDFPFLGACSGNGLLGAYLNTPISTRYAEAVGSTIVSLTNVGKSDALLAGFPDQICVLLGHKEACDSIPVGATLLITGTDCPVQMFRVGSNVYATQFHPEGDSEGFIVRIQAYKHYGYFKPEQAQQLIDGLSGVRTPYAQELLKRFVERYAR
ncbi:MAG: glutamine amidotransferase [Gammaproteobacteria bacterium]|nr:glutamine amidotransferase [Gammaproteobacteria bacterium]